MLLHFLCFIKHIFDRYSNYSELDSFCQTQIRLFSFLLCHSSSLHRRDAFYERNDKVWLCLLPRSRQLNDFFPLVNQQRDLFENNNDKNISISNSSLMQLECSPPRVDHHLLSPIRLNAWPPISSFASFCECVPPLSRIHFVTFVHVCLFIIHV